MKKPVTFSFVLLLTLLIAMPSIAGVDIDYTPNYKFKNLNTGILMSYVEMGKSSGIPVVLIHGATDSFISFSQVGAYLAAKGYRVYIPELRGHGNTSKPADGPYTNALFADDIEDWMKQVKIDQAHFVGHSLGSFVAQEMALSYPKRVLSLTLIGSSTKTLDNPVGDWLLNGDDEFPGLLGMDGEIPYEFLEEWTYSTNFDPQFVEYTYNHAERLPFHTWINVFSAFTFDNTARLSAITVPVLVIWGSEDDFFPIEDQIALVDSLISAEVRFIQKDGIGHNTHWEGIMGKEIAGDIDVFLNNGQNGNSQGGNNNNQGGNGNSQGGNNNNQGGNSQ